MFPSLISPVMFAPVMTTCCPTSPLSVHYLTGFFVKSKQPIAGTSAKLQIPAPTTFVHLHRFCPSTLLLVFPHLFLLFILFSCILIHSVFQLFHEPWLCIQKYTYRRHCIISIAEPLHELMQTHTWSNKRLTKQTSALPLPSFNDPKFCMQQNILWSFSC